MMEAAIKITAKLFRVCNITSSSLSKHIPFSILNTNQNMSSKGPVSFFFIRFSTDFQLFSGTKYEWITCSLLVQNLKELVIWAMQYLTPASERFSTLMFSRYNQHPLSQLAKCTSTAWQMWLHYLALFCSMLLVWAYPLWDRMKDVDYCKILTNLLYIYCLLQWSW